MRTDSSGRCGLGLVHARPPEIIQVDYQANTPATDRVLFNLSDPPGSQTFPSIVKNSATGANVQKVVYARGSSITTRYRIYNPNAVTLNVTFDYATPKFQRPYYPSPEISLTGSENESFALGAGQYNDVSVTVSGFPNYVTLGWLKTKINITSEAGGLQTEVHTNEEYIYFTDDSPTGHMSVPWTEVLDLACKWADGEAGAADVAYASTFGLYFSQLFAYNGGTTGFPAVWVEFSGSNRIFKLTSFFDWDSGYRSGNCVDVSSFLYLACSSVGTSVEMKQLLPRYGLSRRSVVTNPICPIGSDPTGANYALIGWSMHQIVRLSSDSYDPTLALEYDPGGSAYENPPAGWSAQDHWQAPSGTPAYGVARRYATAGDTLSVPQYLNPSLPNEVVDRVEISFALTAVE